MRVLGIICEYNPFHNGHAYQIQKAREESGADALICVMSGHYTQRGEPAIVDKWMRTRMAIMSGADLVIAHYNRISPPKPRAEGSQRPERPTRVQTFGFQMEGPMTKEEFAAGLMQEPASFYYGVMWNKLYRADIVHSHDDVICAEDMDWSEDLYFNLSYIRYAEKFYALSTPIYNYFNTPGSAVHTALNPVNVVATRATLFAYYKELYEHLGLYEEYKPQIYKYLVAVAEA